MRVPTTGRLPRAALPRAVANLSVVALAVALTFVLPRPAAAQFPVCAAPAAGEVFRTACRTWEAAGVLQLLDELTVDHLFKPEAPPFERTWTQLLAPFTSKNLVENEEFRARAMALAPLRFTQLDRTTGTVSTDLASAPRELEIESRGFGDPVQLRIRFPEALDGGYWRGPDVLQIAFWERNRLGLTVVHGGSEVVSGDVECVALSPDGVLVRFAGGVAPLFLRTRDCEQ